MGGLDKALADLCGRPMLARILDRLSPQLPRLVVNANGDPARFAAFGLAVVADPDSERHGPLGGILAGLDLAASAGASSWILCVPCDAPFLPRDLAAGLHAARRRSGAAGAVAVSDGRRHPTVGLWPVAARAAVAAALRAGRRRVDALARELDLAEAEWSSDPFDPFLNVNDSEGLAAAQSIIQRRLDA